MRLLPSHGVVNRDAVDNLEREHTHTRFSTATTVRPGMTSPSDGRMMDDAESVHPRHPPPPPPPPMPGEARSTKTGLASTVADLVKEKEEAEAETLELKKRINQLENDLGAAKTHADQEVARTGRIKKELEVTFARGREGAQT